VVVTVMTNLGFRRGMAAEGIEVIETQVGDRYVLEAHVAGGYGLGGEQSGHVIYPEFATTGDGVLSAVQLLDAVQRSGEPLAELSAKAMTRMPQVLSNVRLAQRRNDLGVVLGPIIEAAEHRLAGRGRVLIRPSGTEPLVRVMVEAESESEAQMEADALVAAVTAALA
jgi:phosphoglucosamine mutase